MRIHKALSIALLLASTLAVGTASSEESHAVRPAEMQAAIAARVGDQASQRAAIQSLLARPEVRQLAANAGLAGSGARPASTSTISKRILQVIISTSYDCNRHV